jgi:ankyrin repeat protein
MKASKAVEEKAFRAVKDGKRDVLIALIEEYPSIRNAKNADGISLILYAIYNQRRELADLLVKFGAEFDVFSASAYGALKDIVSILRFEPELVNTYSSDGWTPLHLAAFFGNIMIVEFLVVSGAHLNAESKNALKNQPLNAATTSNKMDIVQLLLKKGADVHFAQHGGITPLHAAAHNGNVEMVRTLLAHGANPNAKNDKGETPMDMATQQGHTNVLPLLRSL